MHGLQSDLTEENGVSLHRRKRSCSRKTYIRAK